MQGINHIRVGCDAIEVVNMAAILKQRCQRSPMVKVISSYFALHGSLNLRSGSLCLVRRCGYYRNERTYPHSIELLA